MNMINMFSKNPFYLYRLDFLKRSAELLESGFTFYESTHFLLNQYEKLPVIFKKDVLALIESGASMSDVFRLLKFNNHIVMQIYFSEQYGNVIDTINNCHTYVNTQKNMKDKFIKTIQYPLMLICLFIGLIITVNQTVLPQFQAMYESMGITLSKELKLLTFLLFILPKLIFMLLFILIICCLSYYFVFKKQSIETKLNFIYKLPIICTYYRMFITYKFSKDLSFFLSNGVMLKQIISVLLNQKTDQINHYIAQKINDDMQKGLPLVESIERMKIFEPTFVHFIKHGEKNSKLDIELNYYSQYVFEQLSDKVFKLIKSIQPFVFAILGVLIVAMYLIIILPMLQMMEGIK